MQVCLPLVSPLLLQGGHLSLVSLLLAAGAKVAARDTWGRTPLAMVHTFHPHHPTRQHHNCVPVLCSPPRLPHSPVVLGRPAGGGGRPAGGRGRHGGAGQQGAAGGVQGEQCGVQGMCPLHWAVHRGHLDIVRTLLDRSVTVSVHSQVSSNLVQGSLP